MLADADVLAVSDVVSAAAASYLSGKNIVGCLPFKCFLMFDVLPPCIDIEV